MEAQLDSEQDAEREEDDLKARAIGGATPVASDGGGDVGDDVHGGGDGGGSAGEKVKSQGQDGVEVVTEEEAEKEMVKEAEKQAEVEDGAVLLSAQKEVSLFRRPFFSPSVSRRFCMLMVGVWSILIGLWLAGGCYCGRQIHFFFSWRSFGARVLIPIGARLRADFFVVALRLSWFPSSANASLLCAPTAPRRGRIYVLKRDIGSSRISSSSSTSVRLSSFLPHIG